MNFIKSYKLFLLIVLSFSSLNLYARSLSSSTTALLPHIQNMTYSVAQANLETKNPAVILIENVEKDYLGILKNLFFKLKGIPFNFFPNHSVVSLCTGSIVGLNPLTIITAAHCISDASHIDISTMKFKDGKFTKNKISYSSNPAVFLDYKIIQNGPDKETDLAVIIIKDVAPTTHTPLDLKQTDIMSVAPININTLDSFQFCGYGLQSNYPLMPFSELEDLSVHHNIPIKDLIEKITLIQNSKELKCASSELLATPGKNIHLNLEDLIKEGNIYLPIFELALEEDFYAFSRTKNGNYDPSLPMLNIGDSGGPWFKTINGVNHQFAVSHAVLPQLNLNKDLLFIESAIGASLYSDFAKEFLKLAREHAGADITGLDELLNQN